MTTLQPTSFAELLRRHRRAADLSQEALAERAGISRRGVSDIERGLKRPYPDTVSRLADALSLGGTERTEFLSAARRRPVGHIRSSAAAHRGSAAARPVGRERELALLERHLRGSGSRLLLFAGEPGIGKSRLLAEAAGQAHGWGW